MDRKADTITFNLVLITMGAMIAFAANSVLARLALLDGHIGPVIFTLLRFLSGALFLLLYSRSYLTPRLVEVFKAGSWRSALALTLYGGAFSFAYIGLAAGTGALILFAVVQITMIGSGLWAGERLHLRQWAGTIAAITGLGILLSPGFEAPPMGAALLMAVAGIGWGVYSLRGRNTPNPALLTAGNFVRAGLLCIIISPGLISITSEQLPTRPGIALALISGIVTSGIGYIIWYIALRDLTTIKAGVAQLTVPVIAAFGGILVIGEPLGWGFILPAFIILGGVGLATLPVKQSRKTPFQLENR